MSFNEFISKSLNFFSVLISNTVNTDRYNPYKTKAAGALSNFYECKGVLRPQNFRNVELKR